MSDKLPETVTDIHAYFSDGDQWNCAGECAHLRTTVTALRAALDQERADNERLRDAAQHIHSSRTPIHRDRMNFVFRSFGLLDANNNPTALLSGRGEGEGNG